MPGRTPAGPPAPGVGFLLRRELKKLARTPSFSPGPPAPLKWELISLTFPNRNSNFRSYRDLVTVQNRVKLENVQNRVKLENNIPKQTVAVDQ